MQSLVSKYSELTFSSKEPSDKKYNKWQKELNFFQHRLNHDTNQLSEYIDGSILDFVKREKNSL